MRKLHRIVEQCRVQFAEVRRGRWMAVTVAVYSLLIGVFVLVGLRESSVVQFTGLSRVMTNFSHALVLVLPLLAVAATAQAIPNARENGTLEALMGHPVGRDEYFIGLVASRVLALLLPFVGVTAAVGLVGWGVYGQEIPWGTLGVMLGACSVLVVAFVGIGAAISAAAASRTRALIYALLAWAMGVALLDFALIGSMLQWRLNPSTVFALAVVNPVQCARFVLLSAAEPELSVLGPVGYFMVNKLGAGWLATLGVVWPATVGVLASWAGWETFSRSDVV